jgi:hypothetical protein
VKNNNRYPKQPANQNKEGGTLVENCKRRRRMRKKKREKKYLSCCIFQRSGHS